MDYTTDKIVTAETQLAQKKPKRRSSMDVVTQLTPSEHTARDTEWNDMPEATRMLPQSEEGMSDSVEEAHARITETRAEMSATIEEIKERVSPQHLVQEAKEAVLHATIGKAGHAMHVGFETAQIVRSEVSNTTEEIVAETKKTARDMGCILKGAARRNSLLATVLGIGICCLWLGLHNLSGSSRSH
jgi:hypothetical protein